MRKKKQIKKRYIKPDTKYNMIIISKLINFLMKGGKIDACTKIVYNALNALKNDLELKERYIDDKNNGPWELIMFNDFLSKIEIEYIIKRKKVGGAIFKVPIKEEDVFWRWCSGLRFLSKLLKNWGKKYRNLIKDNVEFKRSNSFKKLFLEIKNTLMNRKSYTYQHKLLNLKIAKENKAFEHFKY